MKPEAVPTVTCICGVKFKSSIIMFDEETELFITTRLCPACKSNQAEKYSFSPNAEYED